MKPFLIDVPVLLIFFNREEQFKRVFEQVKIARPSKLYLYQDGARAGRDDEKGIKKCRQIAEDIDWDCQVNKFYQEVNMGCDPSEFVAQKWMFSTEEMGIVLEDDDIPSQSFFPFCKELLEKYRSDERINIICGMNNNDVSEDINESYLFTRMGSIWGWASWRRVIDSWDENYSVLKNDHMLELMKASFDNERDYRHFIKTCEQHKKTGRAHYESIMAISMFLNNRLNIVPKFNMISNCGVAEDTTHSVNDIRLLPKKIRKLMYKKTYEIDFPLTHPKYVIRNQIFEKKMTFSRRERFILKCESVILKLRYLGIKEFAKTIYKKLRII